MVNKTLNIREFSGALILCATVLTLAAWLRGAEYDEQYTMFLTAGVPRPDWPETAFPAGLAQTARDGHAGPGAIARDLRATDVHPPLYFWLLAPWRRMFGGHLFVARLFSAAAGLGAIALIGLIAARARIPPMRAMLLTLGCYAFTYTSAIARGFALAQLLLLGGAALLLAGRRGWHFAAAGALLGAATLTNYLAVFAASGCLAAAGLRAIRRRGRPHSEPADGISAALNAMGAFLLFIPADLWWFLAQRGSRDGQFPPFALVPGLLRLLERGAAAVLGGLPLYLDGVASSGLAALLGLLLLALGLVTVRTWRRIGLPRARTMFAAAAIATPAGLLALGAIFDNTPIELRYLAFSTPFLALLLAGALSVRASAIVLAIQAASLAGLMLAPRTMQPARAAAVAAAALVEDGIVLLPRGNDGVGVVGAFAIEAPRALPLLLVRGDETPEEIGARTRAWDRVILVLLEQDANSRTASAAMRLALTPPNWREVARRDNVVAYARMGQGG